MAWIETVSEKDAKGALKRHYDNAAKRAGKVFNIVKISSLKPQILQSSINFYLTLMHSPGRLSRAQREMIAVVVSATNNCFY